MSQSTTADAFPERQRLKLQPIETAPEGVNVLYYASALLQAWCEGIREGDGVSAGQGWTPLRLFDGRTPLPEPIFI